LTVVSPLNIVRCASRRSYRLLEERPLSSAIAIIADREPSAPFSFRRFLLALAAFLALPPLLLAGFVVVVDPYYVFGSPSWPGLNVVRPLYDDKVLIAKPYQVQRIKPAAVALGSSIAEVGLDPHHGGWADRNVFNFGLPSASSYEVMLAFLQAQAVGRPLKQAVVGLDFFAFNIYFARNQQVLEARFAGDGARAFADFLAVELPARHLNSPTTVQDDGEPSRPGASPDEPSETAASLEDWNEALYLAVNADVAAAIRRNEFKSGLDHYERAGRAEGRKGARVPRDWNELLYLRIYPDVATEVRRGTFLSGYHHYLAAGQAEGRQTGTPPSGWNEALYLKINADVRAEVARGTFLNGYHHYLAAGWHEKREGGFVPPDWDETTYLQVHPDVQYHISQGLFLSGYHHYLVAGRAEKRLGGYRPTGWDNADYLARNPAARIRVALGEYSSGYGHYLAAGQSQGLLGGFQPVSLLERLQLRWPALNQTMFQLEERIRLVFSMTSLSDSIATVLRQSEPASFDDRGMRVWTDQEREFRRLGGNGRIFRGLILGWRWYFWLRPPRYTYCFSDPGISMTAFDPYRFMLRRAYSDGTDLRLYMTPSHAAVRVLLVALGLGERYEYWQKELVHINDEEAARAGRTPFPLWDFSDANSISSEDVPAMTDTTPMKWHWEYSHFRPAAGDLILDRVLGHTDTARAVPTDFGVRLNGGTLDAHLAGARARIADWAATNTEFASQIRAAAQSPNAQTRQREAKCW
jgi:hypothetical protein